MQYAMVALYVCRYTMLKHIHEAGNRENKERFDMLEYVSPRIQRTDGLNNLRYAVCRIVSYAIGT